MEHNNNNLLREIYENQTLGAVKSAHLCLTKFQEYAQNHVSYVYSDSHRQYNDYDVILTPEGMTIIGNYNLDLVEFNENKFQKHKSQIAYSKNKKARKFLLKVPCDLSVIIKKRIKITQFSIEYIHHWLTKVFEERLFK